MKALRYYNRNRVDMDELPVPDIASDEVLVETRACGICSSDVLDWYREPRAPMFFGHEPAGVVVQKGEGVETFPVGSRVFAHHHVPCFVCRYCETADYSMCEDFGRSKLHPGGFSEYIRVPGENVRKGLLLLPEDVSFEAATLVEPVACCVQAIERSGVRHGDRVAIFGAGFNGLVIAYLLTRKGIRDIVFLDPDPFRQDIARKWGNTVASHPDTVKPPPRMVFVTPPVTAAMQQALQIADRGGTVMVYAPTPPTETFPLEPYSVYFKHLTIKTSYSASPLDTRKALPVVTDLYRLFREHELLQEYFWEDYEKAFKAIRADVRTVKSLLRFETTGGQQ